MMKRALAAFIVLDLALRGPALAAAATVSNERTVKMFDGSTVYIFQLTDHSLERDGDVFVAVTAGGSRTVYRPVEKILADPEWAGYRGVMLPAKAKPSKFEVVLLKPAGVAPEKATGKWILADLGFDLMKLKVEAEGDPKKGYALTATITPKDGKALTATGQWSASDPSKAVFTADNGAKPLLEATVGKAVPKAWFEPGGKLTMTLGLATEWQAQLKSGVPPKVGAKDEASGKYTVDIEVPFKLKIDPTQAAFAMMAHIDPVGKTATVGLDAGQSWEKPFGLLPSTFDTLTVGTDAGFTGMKVNASGVMNLFVKSPMTLELVTKTGAPSQMSVTVKPGADFIKILLETAGIPGPLKPVVAALLPGTVLHEAVIVTSYDAATTQSKPDLRLKFTMAKSNWKKDFDITVKQADLNSPDDVAKKAGPQVFDQLSGDAVSGALALLGVKFKWTLVDIDLKAVAIRVDAEGDPKKGYDLTGEFKFPVTGKFAMKGHWDPAKPTDPLIFESDNIFKPILEKLLGGAVPKDRFELKDKMFVTFGLSKEALESLKGGGGDGSKGEGSSAFSLDVSFPMKLQIDPTKPAFDMTARIFPLEKTGTIELDKGVVWDKPFGILPGKVDALTAGSDPSMTSLTFDGSGQTDFLGDMRFNFNIVIRQGEDPKLSFDIEPSPDMAKVILKKVRIPAALGDKLPKLQLNAFTVKANFQDLAVSGKLPSARIKFGLSHPSFGQLPIDVDVPEMSFNEPDKFAATVAEQISKNLSALAKDMPVAVVNNLKDQAGDFAKDPVGSGEKAADDAIETGEDLGKGAEEFAKDPAGKTQDMAEQAFDTVKDIGTGLADQVSGALSDLISDPVGTAKKRAEEAIKNAEKAFDTAKDLLSDAAEFLSDLLGGFWDWVSGADKDKARAKKKRAQEEVERQKAELELTKALAAAEVAEAEALQGYRTLFAKAQFASDCDRYIEYIKDDPACTNSFGSTKIARPDSAKLIEEIMSKRADITKIYMTKFINEGNPSTYFGKRDGKVVYGASQTAAELKNLKSIIDGDPSLTDQGKSELKSLIDQKLDPPAATRDDALTKIKSIIPRLTDEGLEALKKHLAGTKVEEYVMFPKIDQLAASDKTELTAQIDKAIEAYKARNNEADFAQAKQTIKQAKTLKALDLIKGYLADKTSQRLSPMRLGYLRETQFQDLRALIDERKKTIATEGPEAILRAVKASIDSALEAGARDPRRELKALSLYISGGFNAYGSSGDPVVDQVQLKRNTGWRDMGLDSDAYATLSDVQKKALATEIQAVIDRISALTDKPDDSGASDALDKLLRERRRSAVKAEFEAEIKSAKSSLDLSAIRDALGGKIFDYLPSTGQLEPADVKDLTTKVSAKLDPLLKALYDDALATIGSYFTTRESLDKLKTYLDGGLTVDKVKPMRDIALLTDAQKALLKADAAKRLLPFAQVENIRTFMKRPEATESELTKLDDLLRGLTNTGLPQDLGSVATLTKDKTDALRDELAAILKPFAIISNIRYLIGKGEASTINTVKDVLDGKLAAFGEIKTAPLSAAMILKLKGEINDKLDSLAAQADKDAIAIKKAIVDAATPEAIAAWSGYMCATPRRAKPTPDTGDLPEDRRFEICRAEIYPREKALGNLTPLLDLATTDDFAKDVFARIDASELLSAALKTNLKSRVDAALSNAKVAALTASLPEIQSAAPIAVLKATAASMSGLTDAARTKFAAAADARIKELKERMPSVFSWRIDQAKTIDDIKAIRIEVKSSDVLTEEQRSKLETQAFTRLATFKSKTALPIAIGKVRERLGEGSARMAVTLNAFLDTGDDQGYQLGDASALSSAQKEMLKKEIKDAVEAATKRSEADLAQLLADMRSATTRYELDWLLETRPSMFPMESPLRKELDALGAKLRYPYDSEKEIERALVSLKYAASSSDVEQIIKLAESKSSWEWPPIKKKAEEKYATFVEKERKNEIDSIRSQIKHAISSTGLAEMRPDIQNRSKWNKRGARFIPEADEKSLLKELDDQVSALQKSEAAAVTQFVKMAKFTDIFDASRGHYRHIVPTDGRINVITKHLDGTPAPVSMGLPVKADLNTEQITELKAAIKKLQEEQKTLWSSTDVKARVVIEAATSLTDLEVISKQLAEWETITYTSGDIFMPVVDASSRKWFQGKVDDKKASFLKAVGGNK